MIISPSRRTASPLGSDWESEAYGLPATINTQSLSPHNLGLFCNKHLLLINKCSLFALEKK